MSSIATGSSPLLDLLLHPTLFMRSDATTALRDIERPIHLAIS
jgi:hypothetical protein